MCTVVKSYADTGAKTVHVRMHFQKRSCSKYVHLVGIRNVKHTSISLQSHASHEVIKPFLG